MKKRFLSILMALSLALSLLPTAAFATEGEGTTLPEVVDGVITLEQSVSISDLSSLFTDETNEIIIDLKGNTLTYTGGTVTLSGEQSLTFKDSTATGSAVGGTLSAGKVIANEADNGSQSVFNPMDGASVSAENVSIESNGTIFYPRGDAASVTISNCNISTTGVYCVGTNATNPTYYGVEIYLYDSVLSANNASTNDNCTVMINGDSDLAIKNCKITGNRQAVLVRAGRATITDSEITTTGGYDSNYLHHYVSNTETTEKADRWFTGNEVPAAALVVGNYVEGTTATYAANAEVEVTNTTLTGQNNYPAIYVDANTSYSATVKVAGSNTNVSGKVEKGLQEAEGAITISITGGTFSTDVSAYVDDGYRCNEPVDGSVSQGWIVTEIPNNELVVEGSVDNGAVTGSLDGKFDPNGTTVTDETDDGVSGSGDTTGVTDNVEVKLTTIGGKATTTTLNVTQATAKSLEEANSLTVQTDAGNVSFNSAALDKIAGAESSVVITVTDSSTSYTGGDVKAAYTVTATGTSGNLLPVGGNNGTVTITVTKPDGENIQAWYVTGDSSNPTYVENLKATPGGDNQLAIEIGHLSTIVLRNGNPPAGSTAVARVISSSGTTDYTDLQTAINNATAGDTVQLLGNVTVNVPGTITSKGQGAITISKNLILDGNGKTITAGTGFVKGDESWSVGAIGKFHVINITNNADVEVRNLTVNGSWNAAEDTGDSQFNAARSGINVYNAGNVTLNKVTVEACSVYGVAVNGTTSSVTATELTVKDSNRWGVNVDNGGTINMVSGTIDKDFVVENSKNSGTGKANITGGTFNEVVKTQGSNVGENALTITGGEFKNQVTAPEGSENTISISGGTFSDNVSDYLEEGLKLSGGESGTIVPADNTVATVKDANGVTKGYTSLQNAIAAAKSGDVITLQKDIPNVSNTDATSATSAIFTIPNGVKLDGNNKTISADAETWKQVNDQATSNHILSVESDGTAAVQTTIKDLTIIGVNTDTAKSKAGIHAYNGANVVLENVTIQDCGSVGVQVNGATVKATDVDISGSGWGSINVDKGSATATASLNFVSGDLLDDVQIYSESNSGSSVTTNLQKVTGGDGDLEDKTYYTDDPAKLGEATVKKADGTITVYEDLDNALKSENLTGAETVTVVKNAELTSSATIPNGVTLVVESDAALNIGSGLLTNNGTVENHGTISGTYATGGTGTAAVTVTFTGAPAGATIVVRDNTGAIVSGSGNVYTLKNGTYTYTVSANGYYTRTDSFTVSNNPLTLSASLTAISTDNGGGSGGSSEPSYSPVIDITGNGTIKVSPRTPSEGDEVTITPDPDNGYEVGSVTVTDRSGREVDVTANRNGTYTFTQPAGRVTIEVTFVRTGESTFFTDVPETFWAYDEIAWAYENGYVNGVTATTFNPNGAISRQQVWMILARLSGYDPADMAAARAWAMENGVSDGTNPGNAVTRQQLVALLFRFAELRNYANDQRADLSVFPDVGTVAEYAVEPMQWSVANDIVGGTTAGTLNPEGTATRAQFAVILYRFWTNV